MHKKRFHDVSPVLGQRLRRWRERAGLELSEAAAMAEVGAGYLSELERGTKRNPGLYVLERLSYVYGTTLGMLLETDPTERAP